VYRSKYALWVMVILSCDASVCLGAFLSLSVLVIVVLGVVICCLRCCDIACSIVFICLG